MLPAQQPQRSMARYVSIERDLARHAGRLGGKSFAEERLSRCDAAIGAKQKIDCLAVLVDGAVQVMPLALDRDVGLVDSPGGSNRFGEPSPPLLELRYVASYPSKDPPVSC
jgi:hypothetical protein